MVKNNISRVSMWSLNRDISGLSGSAVLASTAVTTTEPVSEEDLTDNPVLNSWETPWSGVSTYQKSDRVLFEGTPYESKWWNSGESPEAASSNPDGSPWVPLTLKQIEAVTSPAQ